MYLLGSFSEVSYLFRVLREISEHDKKYFYKKERIDLKELV